MRNACIPANAKNLEKGVGKCKAIALISTHIAYV